MTSTTDGNRVMAGTGGRAALAVAIMSATFLASSAPEAASARRSLPKRQIVVALDITGSFKFLNEALSYLSRIGSHLQSGDELVVMTVGADSFADDRVILHVRMPEARRALDPGFRRRLAEARRSVVGQLARLRIESPAMRTDLVGSLHAAVRLLSPPSDRERWLVLLSDMIDDVNRPSSHPIDLTGVRVRCLFVQRGTGRHSVSEFARRVAHWSRLFAASGVTDQAICDPAQSMRIENPFTEVRCDV